MSENLQLRADQVDVIEEAKERHEFQNRDAYGTHRSYNIHLEATYSCVAALGRESSTPQLHASIYPADGDSWGTGFKTEFDTVSELNDEFEKLVEKWNLEELERPPWDPEPDQTEETDSRTLLDLLPF